MNRFSTILALTLLAAAPLGALEPLPAPATGKIRVAFALAPGATMIDFTGPWEVFQDVHVYERGETHDEIMPFELFTVAESLDPVEVTGGMRIVPDYTFDEAPQPDVIVVPALLGSEALYAWLRRASQEADITMSVCTGAFQLARAGLLEGLRATTHHRFIDRFEKDFPEIDVERGVRWVDNGRIATAAGLTSGIDTALHVVARYFGETIAAETAEFMEHHSTDWKSDQRHVAQTGESGDAMAARRSKPASVEGGVGASTESAQLALRGLDPVALIEGEEIEGREELRFVHGGFEYRFADSGHRETFARDPERWGIQLDGACAKMGAFDGRPGLFAVHEGRIYIFGTEGCRQEFVAEPETFLARHEVSD